MNKQVNGNIWVILLMRGMFAVLFGIAAVFWPGITLVTLVYLFSAFILVNGLIGMVSGITTGGEGLATRVLVILLSLLQVGVGVYLLRHPLVSFSTLILLIGFTLVVQGVFEVVGGLFAPRGASHKLLTIISGVLSALAGIVVLFQPASAGVAFVWIVGLWALLTGPLLIALALELKNADERVVKRI